MPLRQRHPRTGIERLDHPGDWRGNRYRAIGPSAALDAGKFRGKVQRDTLDGQKAGVNATPTIFINGKRLADRSYEGLKAALDASLKGR